MDIADEAYDLDDGELGRAESRVANLRPVAYWQ